MKIFLACPVRGISDEYRNGIETQVAFLESQGHQVHYPARDTNQNDSNGLRICSDNRKAIESADVVYVIWDGKSQGVLFDLGMSFALGKPVRTITGYMPAQTNGKSFQNMVFAWEETPQPLCPACGQEADYHYGGSFDGCTGKAAEHNWKHAPVDSDAFWKCLNCGKLDFNPIPEVAPTCAGNISARIDAECKLVGGAS